MTQFFKFTLSIVLLATLAACASPAQKSAMIVEVTPDTVIDKESPLLNAVKITKVSGGESTNPAWTSEIGNPEFEGALRDSLANHAMLAKSAGRFALTAQIISVDQPLFGASLTVTSKVKYTVIEKSSGKVIFENILMPIASLMNGKKYNDRVFRETEPDDVHLIKVMEMYSKGLEPQSEFKEN